MAQSISQEAIGATGLPGATAASRHAGACLLYTSDAADE